MKQTRRGIHKNFSYCAKLRIWKESESSIRRKPKTKEKVFYPAERRAKSVTGKHKENYNRNYINYVNAFDPPTKHFKNCYRAFIVGGFICCVGQFFRYLLQFSFHLSGDELAGSVSVLLIFSGSLLTGLGVYDRIGRNAGAGSIVPITGFANSVTSPALEFKTEGFIYGMAAKMFIVAGPIIVYGVSAGVITGIVYRILYLLGLLS